MLTFLSGSVMVYFDCFHKELKAAHVSCLRHNSDYLRFSDDLKYQRWVFCLKSFHYSTLFYHSDLLLLETDYERVCVCV